MKTFMENTKSLSKKNVQEQPVSDTATNLQQALSSDSSLIPVPFIFIKSDLRLVIDLQTCIKAQQSEAYAQKVKLTNLKQMAQTVAYIQEHGYDTRADFNAALTNAESQTSFARKKMKDTEQSGTLTLRNCFTCSERKIQWAETSFHEIPLRRKRPAHRTA